MRKLSFTVPIEYNNCTIKAFLRGPCGLSARLMIRLKYEPLGITKNGIHARVIETVKTNDVICIVIPDDTKSIEPVSLPLSLLYEDDDFLVVDKQPNMPIYPTPGHDKDSLANAVSAYYQQKNQQIAFRPLFRLDKDTTGIVVLAKNSYSAFACSQKISKKYIAVCEGELKGTGKICHPIQKKEGHRIQREVNPLGERAVTHYRVLSASHNHSLVEFQLETGRTHQIRVHMSFIGHPLAGDDFYGGSRAYIHRQALHCSFAEWIHPVTQEQILIKSPYHVDMQELIYSLNLTI